jgi:hypothetical protein
MACVYLGAKVLVEDNKRGCIDYFQDRGYSEYLAWMPGKNKPGISNSAGASVNALITELTDHNIIHYINNCVFTQLIDDWLKFNPAKTAPFDAAMAYGFALILYKHVMSVYMNPRKHENTDIGKAFRYYRVKSYRKIYGRG